MGHRETSVAIQGKTVDEICDALGLIRSGEFVTTRHSTKGLPGRLYENGWYLVVCERDEISRPEQIRKLSENASVLICEIHVGTNSSKAALWCNGQQIWSVCHSLAVAGPAVEIEVIGDPPEEFHKIRAEKILKIEQEKTSNEFFQTDHMFEIPVELVESMTGYRYSKDGMPAEFLRARNINYPEHLKYELLKKR